jgi:catabolite regulation protein CreA
MEEDMKNFIISCVNLGKELIDKQNLSKKEEKFIENLDVIIEKYFN